MYGMKTLSSGLQKAAGENLRVLINRIAFNDVSGVLTGFALTVLVQSSTATSVLFVGLINAGLINLRQGITLIMGANIGTTVKALLLAYSGININLQNVALVLAAISLPVLFVQRNNLRSYADVMMGLAIMFLSIGLIKSSLDDIENNQDLIQLLSFASGEGFGGVILSLLTGMILTMIIQSSSAMMTLTLILSQKGILSFEMASAMIIGENIGTTITANLAAIVANKNGKRLGLWHTMNKVFGATWALLLFYPILNGLDYFVQLVTSQGSPYTNTEARTYALAFLHVGFNIVNTLLLIGFVPQIQKLLEKIIPENQESEQAEFNLNYSRSGIIKSPELDLLEVEKSIEHFVNVNRDMFTYCEQLLTRNENTAFYQNIQKIQDSENYTDKLDYDISEFLNKTAEQDISKTASTKIRKYLSLSKDLERIADSIYQISKVYERKLIQKIWFNPEQREGIRELIGFNKQMFEDLNEVIHKNPDFNTTYFENKKYELVNLCERLKVQYMQSIEQPDFNIKSGTIFIDLITIYQKMGEQIISVSNNYN